MNFTTALGQNCWNNEIIRLLVICDKYVCRTNLKKCFSRKVKTFCRTKFFHNLSTGSWRLTKLLSHNNIILSKIVFRGLWEEAEILMKIYLESTLRHYLLTTIIYIFIIDNRATHRYIFYYISMTQPNRIPT